MPDGARAALYRHAAKALANAKDTSYGWIQESEAAKTLEQFGPYVPTNAFADVYQAVSYTHLDVYKRQCLPRWRAVLP